MLESKIKSGRRNKREEKIAGKQDNENNMNVGSLKHTCFNIYG